MSNPFDIEKSSRHSKIIGEFGEAFLCNWLSRSGFEVTIVDHTGVDIMAYRRTNGRRLGITVKSRTRDAGKEAASVNVFFKRKDDRGKLKAACEAFNCEPWVAVYVEMATSADLYLTSLEHFDQAYCPSKSCAIDAWKMGEKQKRTYEADNNVQHISVQFKATNWTFSDQRGQVVHGRAAEHAAAAGR